MCFAKMLSRETKTTATLARRCMMKFHCALGDKVSLVPHHWLRPYESGIVVDQQRQALKKWLVQFPDIYPGGGIGGDKIWCDENDCRGNSGAAKNPVWSVASEEVPLMMAVYSQASVKMATPKYRTGCRCRVSGEAAPVACVTYTEANDYKITKSCPDDRRRTSSVAVTGLFSAFNQMGTRWLTWGRLARRRWKSWLNPPIAAGASRSV